MAPAMTERVAVISNVAWTAAVGDFFTQVESLLVAWLPEPQVAFARECARRTHDEAVGMKLSIVDKAIFTTPHFHLLDLLAGFPVENQQRRYTFGKTAARFTLSSAN